VLAAWAGRGLVGARSRVTDASPALPTPLRSIIHWGSRGRRGYHTPRLALSWGCADDSYEPPYFSRDHLPFPPMHLRAALACAQMLIYHERACGAALPGLHGFSASHGDGFRGLCGCLRRAASLTAAWLAAWGVVEELPRARPSLALPGFEMTAKQVQLYYRFFMRTADQFDPGYR
jgi:hypothetical protein